MRGRFQCHKGTRRLQGSEEVVLASNLEERSVIMAGVAGILVSDNGELDRMLERIKYRGPHKTWINRESQLNLGCLELNVGGDSKAVSHYVSDGKRAVVLDGRVYNPEKSGMSDAEAVLYFYNRFGTQFAEKLDGDFACAISDNGQMILARDWAGIKPLYYGHSDGKLCFASEAKYNLPSLCP